METNTNYTQGQSNGPSNSSGQSPKSALWHNLIIPIAIVIAGVLIALAIYTSNRTSDIKTDISKAAPAANIEVAPITEADHIQGDYKTAKVTIIEYSDTECPFCKQFHDTVGKVYADNLKSGKVAWVYRHFPLVIHSKAPKEAEATECAKELGGEKVFWTYLDTIYKNTPSNDGLDPAQLIVFADKVGLDKKAFKSCLDSNKYSSKISEQVKAGAKAGAKGTPYTVLFVDGKFIPLVDSQGRGLGALPYDAMKQIISQFAK